MAIYGTALLALCTVLGAALGDLFGVLFHVKANVGGVGIAMILLVAARHWLARRGRLTQPLKLGVEFWALLYIPVVVAMAAQQDVRSALSGGPMVMIVAVSAVTLCFGLVAVLGKTMARAHD